VHEWIKVVTRMGQTIGSPSQGQLRSTLDELFQSPLDEEHPDSWLECGSEEGELHTLSIFQSGRAIYTRYSDADMTDELEVREVRAETVEEGLRLWNALAEGRHGELR
jgi:hypothetical protein